MGYLIAALAIILAIMVAVAVAEFLFGLLVFVAAIVVAVYLWRRLRDPRRRPDPIPSADPHDQSEASSRWRPSR